MLELKDRVKDVVSGYKGIVIGITTWLHGCRRITVQAESLQDGKPVESQCFDEAQLELVKRGAVELPGEYEKPVPKLRATGGPITPPKQRGSVSRY